jgi:hypothetical protein
MPRNMAQNLPSGSSEIIERKRAAEKWGTNGWTGVDLKSRRFAQGALKRKGDTFLPLLEHAIAYLNESRVRFNAGG